MADTNSETVLTDSAYRIPPIPDGGPVPGIRWLRGQVARFTDGTAHSHRRLLVTRLLDGLPPASLRTAANLRATELIGADDHVDVAARLTRVVPVDVLRAAMGLPDVPAHVVATVARAYQPNTGPEDAADRAVAALVTAFGAADDETAARICVLVQACDATAGLIGSAVTIALRHNVSANLAVAAALRDEPPVLITRRAAGGRVVTVDLTGLPFGAGPHACPGSRHAMAVAAGVVDALAGWTLVSDAVEFEPSPALRVPVSLVVTR